MNVGSFDVLVVGGGPAGCALGLHLARAGCSVAVLERTDYADFRAGESLPPNGVPRLARLGIWESFLKTKPLPVYGVQSAWGTTQLESSSFLSNPSLNGWHLDRPRFDAMLSSAAEEAGAHIFRQAHAHVIARTPRNTWAITAGSPSGELRVCSSFIVDATGRSAAVSRKMGIPHFSVDRMVGISQLHTTEAFADELPSLIETHPAGWWYSAGLPGGRVIAIFFTDSDLCARHHLTRPSPWRQVLSETHHTKERLMQCAASASLQVFPASSRSLRSAAGNSWLAIGDAVIGRDPLSSSGIDFALASAERAFSLLCRMAGGDGSCADTYNAQVRADFAAYLDQRSTFYCLERRWSDSLFWRRRHFDEARHDVRTRH